MTHKILIVDDESGIRSLVKGILEDEGYVSFEAANSSEAIASIEQSTPDLIILDIWLEGSRHDGIELLGLVKEHFPSIEVIMISGHGTIETAVSTIKKGAYDFIEKPFKSDRLLLMVRRALEAAALKRENEHLKRKTAIESVLIGSSKKIDNVRALVEKVAPANSRVLITGEPGTGKEVVVGFLAVQSDADNLVSFNCTGLDERESDNRLFGSPGHSGALEQAGNGILFLNEICDLPLETQDRLLRIMQDGHFFKPGEKQPLPFNARIISSTSHSLQNRVQGGYFREDLYYRLNVVSIHMPPLREYTEDIPELADYFLYTLGSQMGLPFQMRFSSASLALFQRYPWPGNVRQLKNVVEWVLIMHGFTDVECFDPHHLPSEISGQSALPDMSGAPNVLGDDIMEAPLREAREIFEREYLLSQLHRFDSNISKTAEFIGMERSALHRKLKILNVLTNISKKTGV